MTKEQFFKELELALQKVPESDRKEMLYDFEEHFETAMENGKTEAEIIRDLGGPKIIAKDLLADYRINRAEEDKSVRNISQAILATIGLGFFNLVIMVGPIVAILGAFVGISGAAIALTLSPLAWVVSLWFYSSDMIWLEFFISLTICSVGLLLSAGMLYVGKFLYDLLVRYLKFNVRIVKGGN
jgi:uncharacterized membrane protein